MQFPVVVDRLTISRLEQVPEMNKRQTKDRPVSLPGQMSAFRDSVCQAEQKVQEVPNHQTSLGRLNLVCDSRISFATFADSHFRPIVLGRR
jgi:hypothetical protein